MTMMTVDGLDDYNDLLFFTGVWVGSGFHGFWVHWVWDFVFRCSPCSGRVSRMSLRLRQSHSLRSHLANQYKILCEYFFQLSDELNVFQSISVSKVHAR
jgi:hypothetical protein